MNKTAQDIRVDRELIKKTQTERNLEIKHLGTRTGTAKENFTNRLQKIVERMSCTEDMIEKKDISVK